MDAVQEKLTQLLGELDEDCNELNLWYSLADMTAWQACKVGDWIAHCHKAEIFMPLKDFHTLAEKLGTMLGPERFLESSLSNHRYPRLTLRYGDTETLKYAINSDLGYQCHGICVVVHPMRARSRRWLQLFRNHVESAWEDMSTLEPLFWLRTVRASFMRLLCLVFGAKRMARVVFDILGRSPKKRVVTYLASALDVLLSPPAAKTVYFKSFLGKYRYFPKEWFKSRIKLPFAGGSFWIVKEYDRYLSRIYGNWRQRRFEIKPPTPSTMLVNVNMPYREFVAELNGTGIRHWREARKKWHSAKKRHRATARRIARAMTLLELSYTRHTMWRMYLPQKKELLRLHSEGNTWELARRLGTYLLKLEKFAAKKLTVYFDEEIFSMALELLNKKGEHNKSIAGYCKNLRRWIPDVHRTLPLDAPASLEEGKADSLGQRLRKVDVLQEVS